MNPWWQVAAVGGGYTGESVPGMTTCGCLGGFIQRLLLHSLCLLSLPASGGIRHQLELATTSTVLRGQHRSMAIACLLESVCRMLTLILACCASRGARNQGLHAIALPSQSRAATHHLEPDHAASACSIPSIRPFLAHGHVLAALSSASTNILTRWTPAGRGREGYEGGRGQEGHEGGRGGRGPGQGPPRSAPVLPVPTTEFDFDEGLQKFDKQKLKEVPSELHALWHPLMLSLSACRRSCWARGAWGP